VLLPSLFKRGVGGEFQLRIMEIFDKIYTMTAFDNLVENPASILMIAIAIILLYLGIKKEYEPLLLVPIAFGVLLANFPTGNMAATDEGGIMNLLYNALIKTTILPPLIFMGVGAMTDFGPMLRNLRLAFFGAAAQLGIFIVLISAVALGFTPQEAAALGIIGGADGPTAIFIAIELAPHLLGAIAIAAYSYMALVPVILPLISKLTISEKEFKINMKQQDKLYPSKVKIKDLKTVKIIFPIALAVVVCLIVPTAAPLVGMLLFGNLVKEIGANTNRLFKAASDTIMNVATVFLGLIVGSTMTAASFLAWETLAIIGGGFLAFAISMAGGVYAVKIHNLFSKKKINPLIGATGLSAVPMASREANKLALHYDSSNHILQYAMSSNISGVIGSAVAAGVLIALLG